ncbi:MAG: CHC2 zinc finger domain-containing protein, partial [Eubacteriales bacterium]|nr:CHC2 zinc finger domain-containing protein [Eubacteriales bacterium]
MRLFEAVKENVTVRQAAELYGYKPNRSGMIRCIFHNDRSPSMKVDRRYYCFGCGCTGDAVDFTAQLFGLGAKEAAQKLADDFGILYEEMYSLAVSSAEKLKRISDVEFRRMDLAQYY